MEPVCLKGTTYDGLIGRVYGFVWGSIWFSLGCLILGIIGVRGRLFPAPLRRSLVDVAPWLQAGTGGHTRDDGLAAAHRLSLAARIETLLTGQ